MAEASSTRSRTLSALGESVHRLFPLSFSHSLSSSSSQSHPDYKVSDRPRVFRNSSREKTSLTARFVCFRRGEGDDGLDADGHYTLVLVRHGESTWNKENRFTGWVDVTLADSGIEEAHRAAKNLAEEGFTFDIMYTSMLQRAIKTGLTILEVGSAGLDFLV